MSKILVLSLAVGLMFVRETRAQWIEAEIESHGERVTILHATPQRVFAGAHGGVFVSLDNGFTWTKSSTGLPEEIDVHFLEFDRKGRLFLGTEPGVYYSDDSGSTWKVGRVDFLKSNLSGLTVLDTLVFIGSTEGIYRSPNRGRNWTLDTNAPKANSLINAGARLFAGTSYGIFRSDDTGKSWVEVWNGIPEVPSVRDLAEIGEQELFANLTTGSMYRSTNFGASWQPLGDLPVQQYLGLARLDDTLYAGTQYGIFRSVDQGGAWEYYSQGLVDTFFYDIVVSGTNLLAANNNGHVYLRKLSGLAGVTAASLSPLTLSYDSKAMRLYLRLDNVTSTGEVQLFDLLGRVVMEVPLSTALNGLSTRVLAQGAYLVVLDNRVVGRFTR
jgi:photosystem II stability/assembly factor-like uncharacterized protein